MDVECRTHARQLCKEALQEEAFSMAELQRHLDSVAGSGRDFLLAVLQQAEPVSFLFPVSSGSGAAPLPAEAVVRGK